MRHYSMDDLRHYSGYDEYTGSFGPLKASAVSVNRSRGRVTPSHRDFLHSPSLKFNPKRRKCRRSTTRECSDHTNILANHKAKNIFEPLRVDIDGAGGSQNEENILQRQVCLPRRKFSFQKRAGKLNIHAIARLDMNRIAATTDIDTIQRHLENLAFADVTLDDMQHYSHAFFVKLFQIAQLTLEYLMHIQDSLLEHSQGLEKQCEELVTECQQFENESGQHEAEIVGLKRDIRQKQHMMSTLELMSLNASTFSRCNMSEKDSAPQKANALVDDIIVAQTNSKTVEERSIKSAVSCVLCKKRFVSAEYLLRHHQRRHQDTKQKKKGLFCSNIHSDSHNKKKKTRDTSASLPKEVGEQKNRLLKQLIILQNQVRSEQEARDRQCQQFDSQQQQMRSQIDQHMKNLEAFQVVIDTKQEATKQDIRLYTQEAINRLQTEAFNAELMRIQAQKASRAGRLENDYGEQAVRYTNEDAKWYDKVEKLMDTFLGAQASKQQEIDILEQESNKLWSKYNKLRKRQHRLELRLAKSNALDAERFRLDRGEVVTTIQKPIVVQPVEQRKDKVVQIDKRNEEKRSKRTETLCVKTQTENVSHSDSAIVETPAKSEIKFVAQLPAAAFRVDETAVIASEEEAYEPIYTLAKSQQAAHVLVKVARGFLARRAVAKTLNWRITMGIASLEAALTTEELQYVRQLFASQLHVEVEASMTANDLRVTIAKHLSGKNECECANEVSDKNERFGINATMTYHRILLHHKHTGTELSGDTLIHELKNLVGVEIIPYHEIAAMQGRAVVKIHAIVSDRIENIKCASMIMSASDSTALESDDKYRNTNFTCLAGLQARARGYLARKNVQSMKIDLLMDTILVRSESQLQTVSIVNKPPEVYWMSYDSALAGEFEKAHRRMETMLRASLNRGIVGDEDGLRILLQAEYESLSAGLLIEQKALPCDVQCRIRLLTERMTPIATGEYRRRKTDYTQGDKTPSAGAAKIHRGLQGEVVRMQLKRLLGNGGDHKSKDTEAKESGHLAVMEMSLSSSRSTDHETGKSLGSFDTKDIYQLASTYEEEE